MGGKGLNRRNVSTVVCGDYWCFVGVSRSRAHDFGDSIFRRYSCCHRQS
jgi:hypothetical protein